MSFMKSPVRTTFVLARPAYPVIGQALTLHTVHRHLHKYPSDDVLQTGRWNMPRCPQLQNMPPEISRR
jgi:hypothetical protein